MSAVTTQDGTVQGRNFHTLAGAGAVLYIAECVELDALKVGITSRASRTSRVRVHARHGWRTTAEIPFDDSRHAFIAEQAVLAFLRACGARETLRREQLPQGGYTETIAFARQVGLSTSGLLEVARTAAGIVEATEQPSYLLLTALARIHQGLTEILEDIQALRRAGHQKDLDRFAAEARPAFDKLLEHLEDIRADLSD